MSPVRWSSWSCGVAGPRSQSARNCRDEGSGRSRLVLLLRHRVQEQAKARAGGPHSGICRRQCFERCRRHCRQQTHRSTRRINHQTPALPSLPSRLRRVLLAPRHHHLRIWARCRRPGADSRHRSLRCRQAGHLPRPHRGIAKSQVPRPTLLADSHRECIHTTAAL